MNEGIEVYVYTRVPNTGQTVVHRGTLHRGKGKAHFNNSETSHHWMTSLSNNEGEVRGHSVWFSKPNKSAAIKALDAKDKERTEALLQKANRTLERMSL